MITRKMNLELEQELAHRIISLENEMEKMLFTIPDFQETLLEVQDQPRKHNAERIMRFGTCWRRSVVH